MTPYSSFAVVNRSLSNFKSLIDALATHTYTKTCLDIQKRIQGLYEAFLARQYEGLTAEYCVSNESGAWEEELYLRESCHGTPFVTMIFETTHSELEVNEDEDWVEPPQVRSFVDRCFENNDYTHVLFGNQIKQFVYECIDTLADTHTFDIEANEGVLCFQALPINGCGTIRLISRSNDAIVENDLEKMVSLGVGDQSCILKEVRCH